MSDLKPCTLVSCTAVGHHCHRRDNLLPMVFVAHHDHSHEAHGPWMECATTRAPGVLQALTTVAGASVDVVIAALTADVASLRKDRAALITENAKLHEELRELRPAPEDPDLRYIGSMAADIYYARGSDSMVWTWQTTPENVKDQYRTMARTALNTYRRILDDEEQAGR